jgi:hypothetical protein
MRDGEGRGVGLNRKRRKGSGGVEQEKEEEEEEEEEDQEQGEEEEPYLIQFRGREFGSSLFCNIHCLIDDMIDSESCLCGNEKDRDIRKCTELFP